jgi:hypothetical protein
VEVLQLLYDTGSALRWVHPVQGLHMGVAHARMGLHMGDARMVHGAGAPSVHTTTRTTDELLGDPRFVQAVVNKTSVELRASQSHTPGGGWHAGDLDQGVLPVNKPEVSVLQPGPHLYTHAPLPRCSSCRHACPRAASYLFVCCMQAASAACTLPHGLALGSTLPGCSTTAC